MKSRTRFFARIALGGVIGGILIIAVLNGLTARWGPVWIQQMTRGSSLTISVNRLAFLPPRTVILSRVHIAAERDSSSLVLPEVKVKVDFLASWKAQRFDFSGLTIIGPVLNVEAMGFLRRQGRALLSLFWKEPGGDFILRIRNGRFVPARSAQPEVPWEGYVQIRGPLIRGEARWGDAWGVEVEASREQKGIRFYTVDIQHRQGRLALSGDFFSGVGVLKGDGFWAQFSAEEENRQQKRPVWLLGGNRVNPSPVSSTADVFMTDAEVRFDFTDPSERAFSFQGRINGAPVTARAVWKGNEDRPLRLSLTGFSPRRGRREAEEPNFSLNLKAWRDDLSQWWCEGESAAVWERDPNDVHAPERMAFSWKGLRWETRDSGQTHLRFDHLEMVFWANQNPHRIDLYDGEGTVQEKKDRWFRSTWTGETAGGIVQGTVWVRAGDPLPEMIALVHLEGAQAQELGSFVALMNHVAGQLKGNLRLVTHPLPEVTGTFEVASGKLTEVNFLVWLAETFDLDVLRGWRFDRLTGRFHYSPEKSGLEEFECVGEGVALKGFFWVDEKKRVSSRLSLSLKEAVYRQSAKLRRLTALLKTSWPELTFDFQLSGLESGVNFQWLTSAFKERIQERLPGFVERRIERAIEEALSSPPSAEAAPGGEL